MLFGCQQDSTFKQNLDEATQLRASCSPPPLNPAECFFLPVSTPITVEGCTINAKAIFKMCNGNVYMDNVSWDYGNSTSCNKLKQKMYEAYILPINGPETAMAMYNSFYKKIIDGLESSFFGWLGDNNGVVLFPCEYSTGVDCDNWDGHILSYTESGCITLCPKNGIVDGGLDEEGNPILFQEFETVICGNGCCVRKTNFCIDQFNLSICKGDVVKYQLEPCTPVPFRCSQPNGVCSAPCDRL